MTGGYSELCALLCGTLQCEDVFEAQGHSYRVRLLKWARGRMRENRQYFSDVGENEDAATALEIWEADPEPCRCGVYNVDVEGGRCHFFVRARNVTVVEDDSFYHGRRDCYLGEEHDGDGSENILGLQDFPKKARHFIKLNFCG